MGSDLIVEVRSSSETEFIQDGPESRFGFEIILLSNNSNQVQEFQIHISSRTLAVDYSYEISVIQNANDSELQLAANLSEASQKWLNDPQDESISRLLARYQRDGVRPALSAIAHWQYANLLMNTSRYQELAEFLASHESELIVEQDTVTRAMWIWMQAATYRALDRIEEALVYFQSLQPFIEQLGSPDPIAIALERETMRSDWGMTQVLLGLKLGDLTLMDEGVRRIETALVRAQPLNDYKLVGDINNYLAAYQSMRGLRDDAIKTLRIVESFYEQSGNVASLATAKNNQAFSHLRLGNVAEAQRLYREAILLLDRTTSYRGKATVMSRLAMTYVLTGDYPRAENYFRQAINQYDELELVLPRLQTEIELGVLLRLQGRTEEALQIQQRLSNEISSDVWIDEYVRVHTELAQNYLDNNDLLNAQTAIAQVAPLKERVIRLAFKLDAYLIEARTHYESNALAEARDTLASASQLLREAESESAESQDELTFVEPVQQLEILHLLSLLEEARGNYSQSSEYAGMAIALMSTMRNQMDIQRQGATWGSKTREIVNHSVRLLLDRFNIEKDESLLEQAFQVLQENNAATLARSRKMSAILDYEQRESADRTLTGLWDDMVKAKRELLMSSVLGSPPASLVTRAAISEEAFEALQISPDTTQAEFVETLSIGELQSKLSDSDAALIFSFSETIGFGIYVRSQSIAVEVLPGEEAIKSLIASSLQELNNPRNTSDFGSTQKLSALLLSGLTDIENLSSLFIESSGILAQVPASGLSYPNRNSYSPLASSLTITNTPSLSQLFNDNVPAVSNPAIRAEIAVFADPPVGELNGMQEEERLALGLDEGWQTGLSRLPYTALEAQTIEERFKFEERLVYTGEAATISNFLSPQVRQAKILHLASHGFASSENPDFVGFLLAPDNNENSAAFLTYSEIRDYTFKNDLVVISGCETATGMLLRGEGMIGLSNAFLSQGAKATIATLWPISDRATASFMSHFYAALSNDAGNLPKALQAAQVALQRDPLYRAPYYWAPFVLTAVETSQ